MATRRKNGDVHNTTGRDGQLTRRKSKWLCTMHIAHSPAGDGRTEGPLRKVGATTAWEGDCTGTPIMRATYGGTSTCGDAGSARRRAIQPLRPTLGGCLCHFHCCLPTNDCLPRLCWRRVKLQLCPTVRPQAQWACVCRETARRAHGFYSVCTHTHTDDASLAMAAVRVRMRLICSGCCAHKQN